MGEPAKRPHAPKITRRTLSDAVYVCARCRERGTLTREGRVYVCFPRCGSGKAGKMGKKKKQPKPYPTD